MLRPRLIVSLLIENNRLVKTINFKNPRYIGDPLNAVRIFNEKFCDELVLFDIGVTKNDTEINFDLLRKVASVSNMPLCYGGGIRDIQTAEKLIHLGFEKVSISSEFLSNPNLIEKISHKLGTQSIVVTLDIEAKRSLFGRGHFIRQIGSRQKIEKNPLEMALFASELGAGEIIFNSVSDDGMQSGYDLSFAKSISNNLKVPVTFLGGCGELQHMSIC